MRLLFVCPDMHRGGAERHWAALLPALARRGAEVRLICLSDEGPLFHEVRDAGLPSEVRSDLRRALAEVGGRPGAVVTRTVAPQVVGQAIAWRAGAAHVLNEHTPLTAAGDLLPTRPHQRALTRLVAPHVDRVIAVTDRQAAPLVRLGYRRERIVTVPNGVSAPTAPGGRAATRRSLGLEEHDFAVLCLTNLRPEKRTDAFVEAVGRARAQGASRLRGFVAGDGPERERLEQLAAACDGVELLGSRGDAAALIDACDALALLSEAEALPMSILEAMALARPVVTTDVGGTREAVVHGETGFVVSHGEAAAALASLAADPGRARKMGERGRARQLERFGEHAMVEGYLHALEEVATR